MNAGVRTRPSSTRMGRRTTRTGDEELQSCHTSTLDERRCLTPAPDTGAADAGAGHRRRATTQDDWGRPKAAPITAMWCSILERRRWDSAEDRTRGSHRSVDIEVTGCLNVELDDALRTADAGGDLDVGV